jgi:peptidoglycan/xylan/chitin deacetylase (PgdA/CDA1 family)
VHDHNDHRDHHGSASGGGAHPLARAIVRSALLADVMDRRLAGVLRVLTFHTVPDRRAFAAQMAWLADHYAPIGQDSVIAALAGAPLPRRAVWVTFDDGDPSVVINGLPALRATGIPATMFVCPGLIESGEPTWWSRVARADLATLRERIDARFETVDDAVAHLKTVPDAARREVVAGLPAAPAQRQLSEAELERWLDAGCHLGNHSWDHPMLDQCPDEDQRRQVALADDWLRARVPGWVPVFAYPNGNWSRATADELADRGYAMAVLHDHRPARSLGDRFRISRFETRAGDDIARFRGVVSGLQPALAAAQVRVGDALCGWVGSRTVHRVRGLVTGAARDHGNRREHSAIQ